MFIKHEKLVLDLISEHQVLLKQRLDQLCYSLTSVKTVEEPKESATFTQKNIYQRFSNINDKVQSLENKLTSTKEEVDAVQTAKPTWALDLQRKLVDLEDKSRGHNLRRLGIKEDSRESWGECENMNYDLLEEKLEMDLSIRVKRPHHVNKRKY